MFSLFSFVSSQNTSHNDLHTESMSLVEKQTDNLTDG